MPSVRLKVARRLCQSLGGEPADREVILSLREGECILELIRRLAAEPGGLWENLFDEGSQSIPQDVLVILNGSIVSPHDWSGSLLNDGDEVMLLPTFDGAEPISGNCICPGEETIHPDNP